MPRWFAAFFALALAPGCTRQDADAMGRIGSKVQRRWTAFLFSEKNAKVTKSIPLLQQPNSPTADKK